MSFIEANDAVFYFETHGKGPPHFLIGGFTCQHDFFLPVLEGLSAFFRVILMDNRGVGQTKDSSGALSAKLMARDVAILAAALDLQKPHILGHSMGGNIALELGIEYPEQIGKARSRLGKIDLLLLKMRKTWPDRYLMPLYSFLRRVPISIGKSLRFFLTQ